MKRLQPKNSFVFGLLSTTMMLVGCDFIESSKTQTEEIVKEVELGIERGRAALEESQQTILELPDSYLGSQSPIRIQSKDSELPEKLLSSLNVNYADAISLESIGRLISNQTGLRVDVQSELRQIVIDKLTWSGDAIDLLNQLTGELGIFWKWKSGKVELYRTELRYWTIYSPNIYSNWTSTINLTGSAGSGGSDLSAKDNVTVTMDDSQFWIEVELTVRELLSPDGKLTVSPQSGELAVIDTPSSLDRIDEWVRKRNRLLASQVLLAIDLYEIVQSNNSKSGFDLDGFVQLAHKNGLITLNADNQFDESIVSLKYDKSNDATDHDILGTIRASAGESQVSKLTSTVVRGLNGQPLPVFFGDEKTYLKQRDVIQSEGGPTTRLIPGTQQDGIALNIVPRILPETNQLMLHATLRTTRIKSISSFPPNADSDAPLIQLPELETRSLLIPVLLRSGETLIVAGLDTKSTTDRNNKGILSKGAEIKNSRASLILLITPRIIAPDNEIVSTSRRILG